MENKLTTLQKLKHKAEASRSAKARMPSISNIAEMLTEMGVKHELYNFTNVVESRSAGRRYVNDRHNGKEGKKLIIKMSDSERQKAPTGVNPHIELDSSDSYYSWNSSSYARQILELLKYLKKIK